MCAAVKVATMGTPELRSTRLLYRRLSLDALDAFHELVTNSHVRRFMLDNRVFPLRWSEQYVRDSLSLFDALGLGTWLAVTADTAELTGFCGFRAVPGRPEPELLYALDQRFTGRGFATEMGHTMIELAWSRGLRRIRADVDAANVASVRVLEKLGFERIAVDKGAFGALYVYVLVRPRPNR